MDYYKYKKMELSISMILLDEMGLAEGFEEIHLKYYIPNWNMQEKKKVLVLLESITILWMQQKFNRALILFVLDLDENIDEIVTTAQDIVMSILDKLKDDKIFELISHSYFEYKTQLKTIKELVAYKLLLLSEMEKLKKIMK